MLLEQYNSSSAMMFVLQETKPLALVVRLGFALNFGRKSAAAAAPPAATTSATSVVDAGAVADLAEQKKSPEGGGRRAQQNQERAGSEDRADRAAGGRAPTCQGAGGAARLAETGAPPRSAAQRRLRPQLPYEAEFVASRHVFGGGKVAENIRSLHHAFRGGQRDEGTQGGRAGKTALSAAL